LIKLSALSGAMGRASIGALLLNAGDASVTTLVAPFLSSRGYPVESIGFLVAIAGGASLLSRLPAGRLAERRDHASWYVGCSALVALSLILYPFSSETWTFVAVRTGHGLAVGTALTLNFSSFLEAATGHDRVRATSLYSMAMSTGYALGNLSAGLIADHFGYGVAFALAGLTAAAAILARPRVLPERPRSASRGPQPTNLRLLLRPDVLAIPLLGLSISLMHASQGTLFPLYALAIGQSLTLVGTARGLQSVATTVSRPFAAWAMPMIGVAGLATFGLVGTAVCVMSIPLTSAPLQILIIFLAMGAFRGFAVVANTLQTAELSQRGVLARGTASSLFSVGQDVAQLVAPSLAGLVAGRLGLGPALQAIPVGAVALGATAMYLSSRFEAAEQKRVHRPSDDRTTEAGQS
jgi:MFS family permease